MAEVVRPFRWPLFDVEPRRVFVVICDCFDILSCKSWVRIFFFQPHSGDQVPNSPVLAILVVIEINEPIEREAGESDDDPKSPTPRSS